LTAKVKEQIATLNDKNRRLEEDAIKIELLESRTKDSKQFSATLQKLEAELASAKVEKSSAEAHMEKFMQEFARLRFEHDATQRELESLRQNASSDGGASVTKRRSGLVEDSTTRLRLTAEIEALATEILSLQSAVRYLKAENHQLRLIVPATNSRPTGSLSWLESADLSRTRRARGGASQTRSEEDVLDALIHLATSTQPLPIMHGEDKADSAGKPSWWRPTQTTARYAALKRRAEWEAWREWKEEGTGRGRVRCRCDAAVTGVKGLPGRGPGKHVAGHEAAGHDGVVVVGSP
jgi:regulator of replication initiation timing